MQKVRLKWGWVALEEAGGRLGALRWLPSGQKPDKKPVRWARFWQKRLELAVEEGLEKPLEGVVSPTGTAFQRQVWRAISKIKRGEVLTYKQLAIRIGCPKACRAVAGACGANPLPIIIPCHRVVAQNGLGGYSAAGGVRLKKRLLVAEGAL
jgi:O-6-methylguanine DNA methyltransferase